MLRFFDVFISSVGLIFGSPILMIIYIVVFFDNRSPLFYQERVGYHKKPFKIIKFRTMKVATKSVATHMVSVDSITRLGGLLRRTKLDELPQLWNVFKGDISLVGPRPNLFNQSQLIEARDSLGVYDVLPGITGLAQVNGVDMSDPDRLVEMDAEMIKTMNLINYFKYIFMTITGSGQGDRVKFR